MKQNPFPPGWDEKRIKDVIAYYETQTEDEAVAEAEEALAGTDPPAGSWGNNEFMDIKTCGRMPTWTDASMIWLR